MTTAARTSTSATLRDLLALTKPRITFMVIVTTAGGIWLAHHSGAMQHGAMQHGVLRALTWPTILLTLIATAMVVGAANTLNCWLERDLDGYMTRTKDRPLPAGRLHANHALALGIVLSVISVPVLTWVANPLTGLLAAVALVSYVMVYTPMKQKSPAALIVGAVPGALPPLMGWTAATGELAAPGLVLFGILFVWQMPHFIAISIFRKDEYAKAGIRVLPSVRGTRVAKRHAVAWAAALLPVSLLLVPLGIAGNLYLVVAGLLGLGFFGWSVMGLREGAGDRWARQLFFASLIYLPVLFAALALDVAAT